LDLNVNSVLDDVISGGREFHVRDAAAVDAVVIINTRSVCVSITQLPHRHCCQLILDTFVLDLSFA